METPTRKAPSFRSQLSISAASLVFQSVIEFNQGGIDLVTTQYIDAYQRGNFWSRVSKAPTYHLLLGAPKVAPVQTIVVQTADGHVGNEFGVKVGLADI